MSPASGTRISGGDHRPPGRPRFDTRRDNRRRGCRRGGPQRDDRHNGGRHANSAGRGTLKGYPIGDAQNLAVRTVLDLTGAGPSQSDWQATIRALGSRCIYCEASFSASVKVVIDHVVPINKTDLGENVIGNVVPACQDCNTEKRGKSLEPVAGDDTAAYRSGGGAPEGPRAPGPSRVRAARGAPRAQAWRGGRGHRADARRDAGGCETLCRVDQQHR